jgi:uncharacterized membrane protein YqjE
MAIATPHVAGHAASAAGHSPGGAFASLKELGHTFIDILHTRFDLLVTEIAEEQVRLAEVLLLAAVALLCSFLAIVIVAVFVVATLWETEYRIIATVGIAVALVAGAIGCGIGCIRKAKQKPKLFSESVSELGADLDRLK